MMPLVYPSYYPRFSCIADRCRHSCCIGWEIDLDEESLKRYRQETGKLGERLRAGIEETEDGAHFRLTEDERCPFLNEKGLCDLIIVRGEDYLCQICADHPRFRSFYSDRTEIGLGLCCEEAGRLILSWQERTELLNEEESVEPEEKEFFALRRELTELAQDRLLPFEKRMEKIRVCCGLADDARTPKDWAGFYLSLERMEEAWAGRLEIIQEETWPTIPKELEIAFEQLLVYFLYRHLPGALEDGMYLERVAFCLLSVKMIAALLPRNATMEDLIEIARMYSAEIEYSDENIQALLDEMV